MLFVDSIKPNASASSKNALNPSLPSLKVSTNSAPSLSNALKAKLRASDSFLAFFIPSANSNSISSALLTCPSTFLVSIPKRLSAGSSSPVPFAASPNRLLKRLNAPPP